MRKRIWERSESPTERVTTFHVEGVAGAAFAAFGFGCGHLASPFVWLAVQASADGVVGRARGECAPPTGSSWSTYEGQSTAVVSRRPDRAACVIRPATAVGLET